MAAYSWKSRLLFTFVLIVFSCGSGWLFLYIHSHQPTPYMDEIFHIPQAQKYCEGKFDQWDPKITTLPGLYLISVGIIRPATYLTGINFCDLFYLRSTNLIFSIGNLYLLYSIVNRLHGGSKDFTPLKACLVALNLALFPVLYFFTFMYYTDVASTFFVLLTYLFHLHGHANMAAIIGLLAVIIRQTNIVWVAFLAALTASGVLVAHLRLDKKETRMDVKMSHRYFMVLLRGTINLIAHHRKRLPYLCWDLAESCVSYVAVGCLFLAFLHQNAGIAVGDRDAHQVCLHAPQLLYFLAFTLLFAFPYFTTPNKCLAFGRALVRKPIAFVAFSLAALLAVSYNTHVHPYLLADNRHYSFYIWRKLLRGHELAQYALIPVYVYAGWAVTQAFHTRDAVWKAGLVLSITATLIPQKLLELRYFILPYLMVRLNMPVDSYPKLVAELALYCTVNAYTMYMFIAKPFRWPDSNEMQRFIW